MDGNRDRRNNAANPDGGRVRGRALNQARRAARQAAAERALAELHARERRDGPRAHGSPGQGPIVDRSDAAALAVVLSGYTNAVEQCAGVPPGATVEEDNTLQASLGQNAKETIEIARDLTAASPTLRRP